MNAKKMKNINNYQIMKNLSFYKKLINYLLLIILFPIILLGQDTADFKWKIYNDKNLKVFVIVTDCVLLLELYALFFQLNHLRLCTNLNLE